MEKSTPKRQRNTKSRKNIQKTLNLNLSINEPEILEQYNQKLASLNSSKIRLLKSLPPTNQLNEFGLSILHLLEPLSNRSDWIARTNKKKDYWNSFMLCISTPSKLIEALKALPSAVQQNRIGKSAIDRSIHALKKLKETKKTSILSDLLSILELCLSIPNQSSDHSMCQISETPSSKLNMLKVFYELEGKQFKASQIFNPLLDMQIMRIPPSEVMNCESPIPCYSGLNSNKPEETTETSPILKERNVVSRETSPLEPSVKDKRSISALHLKQERKSNSDVKELYKQARPGRNRPTHLFYKAKR